MTLEQLRIFVAVAEREHVTRAAEALNLTQSATSAAVAALEGRYQTRLFSRVGRRIELTEAGRLFVAEARAVLARASAAEAMLADLAGLARGTVRLAASQTVANYWLPPRMARFHSAYPQIGLPLTIGNTEQVAHWVEEGIADLGFIEGNIDAAALAVSKVADDRLVLIVHAGHAWATKPPRTWADLKRTGWVVREAGSGTRAMFDAALEGFGHHLSELDIVMELPSNEAILAVVASGVGAAVMSELAADGAIRSGATVAVPFDLPMRAFYRVHHAGRYLGTAASAFKAAVDS